MRTYEVTYYSYMKWYFSERIAPGHVRIFTQFEVSCEKCTPTRTRAIRAVDFTAPGHYKKFPVDRTLVFVCSMCGWEHPEKVRVNLV